MNDGNGNAADMSRDAYKYRPLIVLHDKKSRVWDSPVAYDSEDSAIRQLRMAAKYGKDTKGNPPIFAQYPEDFELVVVGLYDWVTGSIVGTDNIFVGSVANLLKDEE